MKLGRSRSWRRCVPERCVLRTAYCRPPLHIWEVGLWRPTVSLVLCASQGQKYLTLREIEEWRVQQARKPAGVPHSVEAAIHQLGESGLGEAVAGGGGDGGRASFGRFGGGLAAPEVDEARAAEGVAEDRESLVGILEALRLDTRGTLDVLQDRVLQALEVEQRLTQAGAVEFDAVMTKHGLMLGNASRGYWVKHLVPLEMGKPAEGVGGGLVDDTRVRAAMRKWGTHWRKVTKVVCASVAEIPCELDVDVRNAPERIFDFVEECGGEAHLLQLRQLQQAKEAQANKPLGEEGLPLLGGKVSARADIIVLELSHWESTQCAGTEHCHRRTLAVMWASVTRPRTPGAYCRHPIVFPNRA